MANVIAANRVWYKDMPERLAKRTGEDFLLISDKADLTLERLKAVRPRYVFFPHWSHIVPPEIHENFECVIFHMTDVPFGRGGSPLQNLIARGIYETKISAIRCIKDLDAGPVYMKTPFSLHGSAEEILMRASGVIEEMIVSIINEKPAPVAQEGEPVFFKRRTPEDGDIAGLKELRDVYDYVRMLDADGYPRAFIETEHLRLEFDRASLKQDSVTATVRITKKGGRP